MYFAPVSVRPVRKPHCWFSHEAAHVYFAPGLKQYNYLFPLNCTGGHQGSYLENVLTQICSHATSGNCRGSGNHHNWKYTQR